MANVPHRKLTLFNISAFIGSAASTLGNRFGPMTMPRLAGFIKLTYALSTTWLMSSRSQSNIGLMCQFGPSVLSSATTPTVQNESKKNTKKVAYLMLRDIPSTIFLQAGNFLHRINSSEFVFCRTGSGNSRNHTLMR